MPQNRFERRAFLKAIALSPVLLRESRAQDAAYPNRPVKIVLPNTVGGTGDLIARTLAGPVGGFLEQPLVIEARGGAAGRIAVDHVSNAAPDGYTILLANNGTHSIGPAGRGTSPIEPGKSLLPVSMLLRAPLVIAVTPRLMVDSLAALIERARAAPGRISYASSGPGSTSHMAAVMLAKRAGIALQHVPYAGTSAGVRDVLSGEVPVIFTQLGTIATLMQSGQIRALAVTSERRLASFPDLQTVGESGYPGYEISTWHGVVVPAGTPRSIVAKLHTAFVRALDVPDVRRQLAGYGMEPVGDSPEQFAATMEADVRRWAELIRTHGVTAER